MWYFQPSWKQEALETQRWKESKKKKIKSIWQDFILLPNSPKPGCSESLAAGARAQLLSSPPFPNFWALLAPKPSSYPPIPFRTRHKAQPRCRHRGRAGAAAAEFISPFPPVANGPGADGDFLECVPSSKALTETATAQTNPSPPAKPSFALPICPASAFGPGSASASSDQGGRMGTGSGWCLSLSFCFCPCSFVTRSRDSQGSL